jgi:hypothetical protein
MREMAAAGRDGVNCLGGFWELCTAVPLFKGACGGVLLMGGQEEQEERARENSKGRAIVGPSSDHKHTCHTRLLPTLLPTATALMSIGPWPAK